jgi:hypothetical protein
MCAERVLSSEAESNEKHCVWGPMLKLTITSLYVDSRVLQHMGNPIPESTLTLCRSQLYPPGRDLGFGLWVQSHCPQTQ